MTYRVIGIMSGSSLDGLDIAFIEFDESGGKWNYEILQAECLEYSTEWVHKLANATRLNAYEYQLLHTSYGRYIGEKVNGFIEKYGIEHRVQLISSHGHTTFHVPHLRMTGQLGDGAAIAATTQINVVSDLRAMDVAFGGQGAPIVPIGEKLLLGDYAYFLNLGGIANISFNGSAGYSAFDICAANRVLNLIIQKEGKEFDDEGKLASSGYINPALLSKLSEFDYYRLPHPKSLANDFGIETVFPVVQEAGLSTADALRTYTEHVVQQIYRAIPEDRVSASTQPKMLITGGGAFNAFLVSRLRQTLQERGIDLEVPGELLVNYKEALIMGLIGVLRWREEYNVLSSVTGAERSSIGGAVWIGQEA